MRDLSHRFALAALLVSGALTAAIPPLAPAGADSLANSLLAHRQFMVILLGAAMVLSVFVASWRLPAAILGTMSKAGFLVLSTATAGPWSTLVDCGMLIALAAASVILAREQWQEARWHGNWPTGRGAWN